MHYKLFDWWNVLINQGLETYKPNHEIVDLNGYQRPIFLEEDGKFKSNITMEEKTH